jgi:archaellum biogenesis ATPase FlaH
MSNEKLETLLAYRKMGLPIFPMNVFFDPKEGKNQKRPVVKWQKYQTELPTEAEITEWATKYNSWGMATGELSRIIVVDVDTDKIEDAEMVLGVDLHSSMAVKTPSGGMHFYYKWSEELRNTVKIEDSPIDFRGDGGLVVIPPSHGEWGKYEWVHEPSDMSRAMLPELPPQIKALLTINHNKVKVEIDRTGKANMFIDGERNAASVIAIRKLLGKMPQELWMSSGWYAFQHWCKTFCQPAIDDFQIKATFDWWVRANAKGTTAGVTPKTMMEAGLERIEERAIEATAPNTGYDKLDSFIKGWIPGHLYVLTGETNAGKTACACNFMYRAWKQKKKITYFALEPDVGVVEYVAGIHHKKRWSDIKDEDLKLDLPGMSVFTKETHPKLSDLLATIEKMERQDLIIVDHIGYFTSSPDDKRGKTDQESDAIKRIVGAAKKKKTAIMIIAHPRKPMGRNKKNNPLTMNEISGSAAFKQDATDVMILHMDKDEDDPHGMTNAPTGYILLPKVKTGKSGTVEIYFVPDSPVMIEKEEQGHLQASMF